MEVINIENSTNAVTPSKYVCQVPFAATVKRYYFEWVREMLDLRIMGVRDEFGRTVLTDSSHALTEASDIITMVANMSMGLNSLRIAGGIHPEAPTYFDEAEVSLDSLYATFADMMKGQMTASMFSDIISNLLTLPHSDTFDSKKYLTTILPLQRLRPGSITAVLMDLLNVAKHSKGLIRFITDFDFLDVHKIAPAIESMFAAANEIAIQDPRVLLTTSDILNGSTLSATDKQMLLTLYALGFDREYITQTGSETVRAFDCVMNIYASNFKDAAEYRAIFNHVDLKFTDDDKDMSIFFQKFATAALTIEEKNCHAELKDLNKLGEYIAAIMNLHTEGSNFSFATSIHGKEFMLSLALDPAAVDNLMTDMRTQMRLEFIRLYFLEAPSGTAGAAVHPVYAHLGNAGVAIKSLQSLKFLNFTWNLLQTAKDLVINRYVKFVLKMIPQDWTNIDDRTYTKKIRTFTACLAYLQELETRPYNMAGVPFTSDADVDLIPLDLTFDDPSIQPSVNINVNQIDMNLGDLFVRSPRFLKYHAGLSIITDYILVQQVGSLSDVNDSLSEASRTYRKALVAKYSSSWSIVPMKATSAVSSIHVNLGLCHLGLGSETQSSNSSLRIRQSQLVGIMNALLRSTNRLKTEADRSIYVFITQKSSKNIIKKNVENFKNVMQANDDYSFIVELDEDTYSIEYQEIAGVDKTAYDIHTQSYVDDSTTMFPLEMFISKWPASTSLMTHLPTVVGVFTKKTPIEEKIDWVLANMGIPATHDTVMPMDVIHIPQIINITEDTDGSTLIELRNSASSSINLVRIPGLSDRRLNHTMKRGLYDFRTYLYIRTFTTQDVSNKLALSVRNYVSAVGKLPIIIRIDRQPDEVPTAWVSSSDTNYFITTAKTDFENAASILEKEQEVEKQRLAAQKIKDDEYAEKEAARSKDEKDNAQKVINDLKNKNEIEAKANQMQKVKDEEEKNALLEKEKDIAAGILAGKKDEDTESEEDKKKREELEKDNDKK